MAEKSAQNILDALENSKNVTQDRFIYALGIRFVGEHVAKLLAQEFHDMKRIQNATYDDLMNVHEIGPQVAQSVIQFFGEKKNLQLIERLIGAGIKLEKIETTC